MRKRIACSCDVVVSVLVLCMENGTLLTFDLDAGCGADFASVGRIRKVYATCKYRPAPCPKSHCGPSNGKLGGRVQRKYMARVLRKELLSSLRLLFLYGKTCGNNDTESLFFFFSRKLHFGFNTERNQKHILTGNLLQCLKTF